MKKSNSSTKSLKAAALASLVLGAAFTFYVVKNEKNTASSPLSPAEKMSSVKTQKLHLPSLSWPQGRALKAQVSYFSNEKVALMDAPFAGNLEFNGQIRLTGLAPVDHHPQVLFEFVQIEKAALVFNGKRLMAEPGELQKGAVLLTLTSTGAFLKASALGKIPPVAKGVAQQIFSAANAFHGTEETLKTKTQQVENAPFGKFIVEYAETKTGYIRKKTAALDSMQADLPITGEAEIQLGNGFVRVLSENIALGSTVDSRRVRHFSWQAQIIKSASVAQWQPLMNAALSDDLVHEKEQLDHYLSSRSGQKTPENVQADLARFARTQGAEDLRWAYEASAVLYAHPEMAEGLAKLVLDKDSTYKGRAFVLDMLAGTGHSAAQKALQTALSSEKLKADRRYPLLLQRVSMVAQPEQALFTMLQGELKKEVSPTRNAALVALGSAARKVQTGTEAWQKEEVESAKNIMLAELNSSTTEAQKVALMAMGNAAHPELFDAIMTATNAKEPALRGAAAGAFRRYEGEMQMRQARLRLVQMSEDRSSGVQLAALRSLITLGLDEESAPLFAQQAQNIKQSRANDGVLVSVVNKHLQGQARKQTLQAILQRKDLLPHTAGRIKGLLAQSMLQ